MKTTQDLCLLLFGLAICFAIVASITSEVRGRDSKAGTQPMDLTESIESQLGPCDKVTCR